LKQSILSRLIASQETIGGAVIYLDISCQSLESFMKGLFVVPLAVALTAGLVTVAAAEPAGQSVALAAAKKHHAERETRHVRPSRQSSGQIACTIYGCHRIPANCRPVTGYNWWGDPTGFDEVACR
jgi:hypothetical protein